MRTAAVYVLVTVSIASAVSAEPIDDALALARKALQNDGVSTAWRLSQKALSDAPDSSLAHEFAGEVLFRRGDFTRAEAEFNRAAQLNANLALAWWGLGRIAECSSKFKTAEEYFRRAHQLDPQDPRIFGEWAARQRGQQHIEALEKYASMLEASQSADDLQSLRQHIQLDKALNGRKFSVLASPHERYEIPLLDLTNASHLRTYALEVDVNGALVRLVLDTGASGILIQRNAAEKGRVVRLSDATFAGIGDNKRRPRGYYGLAERLPIGKVEFHDAVVRVSDDYFEGAGEGLIGSDVFAQFLVTLDFAGKRVRLKPLEGYRPGDDQPTDPAIGPAAKNFVPVFRFGHLLLLPARLNDSPEALFVIDSGSARTLVSYDLAAEVTKVSHDDLLRLIGVSGSVADVYKTGDLFLQFAGFRQKNLGMTVFDTRAQSHNVGTEISGFLGLPLLNLFTLTINYRDGLVNFDYAE